MVKKAVIEVISEVFFASTLLSATTPPIDDAITLRGTIDQALAMRVVAMLRSGQGDRTLLVTSSGGDPEAAITIGDAVRGLNVTVVVQDYCLSSCALFVALPAHALSLAPNSVLGFHHSQTALLRHFTASYPMARLNWERLRRVSAAETQALQRWGISEWWLSQPMTFLEVGCIRQRSVGLDFTIPRYTSRYTVWMPRKSKLGNAVGDWDVGDIAERKFESVRFTVTSNTLKPSNTTLKICADDVTPEM